jgi:hypothetical protein
VPERQFEFRVLGRLSDQARHAFAGMEIIEVPAETVISATVAHDADVHAVLALIQSLGLQVVSVERVPQV